MEKNKDVIVYAGEDLGLVGSDSGPINKATKPKKLETKIIKYEATGDPLEISSMSHIVFPFFTSRVKNRDVNLEYHFKDMGVKFFSAINSDEALNIKQPGTFEEKIYNFILQRTFEIYDLEKEKLDKRELDEETTEEILKGIISSLEFTFDIPELLDFLELKKNPTYYKKLEEALMNMKYTSYRFEKTNTSKFNKNFFEFESFNFSLINYERLKEGRKNYYKVQPSNFILEKTLKNKQYLYFTKESRKVIGGISTAALRIYKYISMKRFDKVTGTLPIEALAVIIPYELYSMNISNGKKYQKNKINEVTKKIVKNFDSLKDQGYIKDFQEIIDEKGRLAIRYSFTEKLGLVTEHTTRMNTKKIEEGNFKGDVGVLEKHIVKAKRNIYASKAWNKRVDNKINKIAREQGEEYAIRVLKIVYDNLRENVKTTLVQYINGIMKNLAKSSAQIEMVEKKAIKPSEKQITEKIDKSKSFIEGEVLEAEIVEGGVKIAEEVQKVDESETPAYKAMFIAVNMRLEELYSGKELQNMKDTLKFMKTVNALSSYLNGLN